MASFIIITPTLLSLHFVSGARQIAKTAEKLAREKELAKVAIRKEDVDLIADEMEIRDESIVHGKIFNQK